MPLLITVQRAASRCHTSTTKVIVKHNPLGLFVVYEEVRADARLPGGLDEVPPRLDLLEDVIHLLRVGKLENIVGEDKPPDTSPEVLLEEPYGDIALVDHMEGIEDVVEPQLDGG